MTFDQLTFGQMMSCQLNCNGSLQNFAGIMCASKQTLIWTAPAGTGPSLCERIPFVLDVCEETFRLIDQLLTEVWEGLDGRRDWPPKQEQECIAVSCLNLLKLQLHAILVHRLVF